MALEAVELTAPEAPAEPGWARDALVGAVFAGLFALFVAVSWGKWALVTADSARELYVPFQMLHGQWLYRDFYYLYGPVAPAINWGLLALFGARLEVLFVASLTNLAVVMALLYTLARQLLKPLPAAAALFVFFTHFALGRDIWGYAWPYAFAAVYAVAFGLVVLVALARFTATERRGWLLLAGLFAGLSAVTKLEYGFAAVGVCALFLAGRLVLRHRLPTAPQGVGAWVAEAAALVGPAVGVAGGVVGAVLARVEASTVLESVWPTALMKLWNSAGAWHGTAASWLGNAKWGAVDVLVIGGVLLAPLLWRKHRGWVVAAVPIVAAAGFMGRHTLGFYLANAPTYWMGPGFLLLFAVLGVVGWGLVRDRAPVTASVVTWGLVASYGCLVASRTLMTGYNDYTRYQAPVALIAWVALGAVWLPASRAARAGLLALVVALGASHLVGHARDYAQPHVAVTGEVGTLWVQPGFGRPFNQAVAYMRSHLRPGEAIVAAPNEASLYLFTGVDNVLKEDQLFYGYLPTTESQLAAIRRMEARHVRFFALSTYAIGEWRFGTAYMQTLGAWLATRCRVAARFESPAYGLTIYETPFASTLARPVRAGRPPGM